MAFEGGLAHPETLLDDRPARYAGVLRAGELRPDLPGHRHGAPRAAAVAQRARRRADGGGRTRPASSPGCARPAPTILLPRDAAARPARGARAASASRLTDLARLYAGLARGGAMPDLVRRADRPAPAGFRAPRRRAGGGLVRRRHPARGAAAGERAAGPHRLQDRHLLRLSRRLGGGLRPAGDDRASGSGGRTARRCRASSAAWSPRRSCSTPSRGSAASPSPWRSRATR